MNNTTIIDDEKYQSNCFIISIYYIVTLNGENQVRQPPHLRPMNMTQRQSHSTNALLSTGIIPANE